LVVYLGLGLVADLDQVKEALSQYTWWTLLAAFGLAFANYLIRFVKWHYYLRLLEIRIPSCSSFLIFLAGLLMSVTPAKVGEVLRSVLLDETYNIPVERTAPIVIADRLSDMLALLILMSAGAARFSLGWAVWLVGGGMCLGVISAVQFPTMGEGLIRLASRLPVIGRKGDRIARAYESLRTVGSFKVMLLPVLLSVIGWGGECLAFHIIVHGFQGAQIDLFTSTFVYALATVAGAVAMLPGGLGATEASMAGMLVSFPTGLGGGEAAAATVLIRLATLWFAVLVGLIALPIFRFSTRRGKR
jgi:uncharacterized membrane protein YbhN (UPF0104 family)